MEPVRGAAMTCHDVCYSVEVRPAGKLFGKKTLKEILKSIRYGLQ